MAYICTTHVCQMSDILSDTKVFKSIAITHYDHNYVYQRFTYMITDKTLSSIAV